YLLLVNPKAKGNSIERARFIVDEISGVLEFYFDDGVEDEKDAKLAAVKDAHIVHFDAADSLAAELADYCALAKAYRSEIDGLGDFDAKLIDEGEKAVKTLREL